MMKCVGQLDQLPQRILLSPMCIYIYTLLASGTNESFRCGNAPLIFCNMLATWERCLCGDIDLVMSVFILIYIERILQDI